MRPAAGAVTATARYTEIRRFGSSARPNAQIIRSRTPGQAIGDQPCILHLKITGTIDYRGADGQVTGTMDAKAGCHHPAGAAG